MTHKPKYRIQEWINGKDETFYTVQKKGLWWKDVWFDKWGMPSVFDSHDAIVDRVYNMDSAQALLKNCLEVDMACKIRPLRTWDAFACLKR